MKKHMLKFKNMVRVVIVTLLFMTSLQVYCRDHVRIMKQLGTFIGKMDQGLISFFGNSNTPYNTYVIQFGNFIKEFENHITQLITRNPLDTLAREIADYARQQFNAAFGVIKQYNGKGKEHATHFKNDLMRVFSLDIAFANLKTKLTTLYNKAKTENNTELMQTISKLITFIEQKRNYWNKQLTGMNQIKLLKGLQKRMECR